MIALRALTSAEFTLWFARSTERQAEDRAWCSGRGVEEELSGLEQMIPLLLPEGQDTPGHTFCVAEDAAGAVVGFVWFGSLPGQPASTSFLFDVFVKPEHRRRGYAREILTTTMDRLIAQGARQFILNVRADNHSARKLYERLGFAASSEKSDEKTVEMTRSA